MNKNRMWEIGAVLAMVATVAGGWLIGISPQLTTVATANRDRANVIAANNRNEIFLAKLKRDYENIDGLKSQVSTLHQSVPTTADVSSFVTELNFLANARKVTLKSINVSDARAYTPTTQAAAKTTTTPQTNPKITSANFVTIPVTIGVTGDYSKVLDFVNDVQLGRRLFLVSTFSSMGATNSKGVKGSPTTSGGSQRVDSTIAGFMYVLLP
jgi:Tfp pilus assembly protein PilO